MCHIRLPAEGGLDHLALALQDEEVVSEGAAPHQLHAYLYDDLAVRLPNKKRDQSIAVIISSYTEERSVRYDSG